MSTSVATDRMTVEEFYKFCLRPENQGRRLELDEGKVIEMPSPEDLHDLACGLFSRWLGNYLFTLRRGRLYSNDTGLIISEKGTVRIPDLMLFLELKNVEVVMTPEWLREIPSLVVEVISAKDRINQLYKRISQYQRRGVPLIWMIDPQDRTMSVYQQKQHLKVLAETDELTGNGVLPDFHCKVADLFRLPGQA